MSRVDRGHLKAWDKLWNCHEVEQKSKTDCLEKPQIWLLWDHFFTFSNQQCQQDSVLSLLVIWSKLTVINVQWTDRRWLITVNMFQQLLKWTEIWDEWHHHSCLLTHGADTHPGWRKMIQRLTFAQGHRNYVGLNTTCCCKLNMRPSDYSAYSFVLSHTLSVRIRDIPSECHVSKQQSWTDGGAKTEKESGTNHTEGNYDKCEMLKVRDRKRN